MMRACIFRLRKCRNSTTFIFLVKANFLFRFILMTFEYLKDKEKMVKAVIKIINITC